MRRITLILLFFVSLSSQAQSVYKTPSGKKYHLGACKMVKNVSEKLSVQEAAEKGLDPCKICKPTSLSIPQNIINKAKGENKTVQC